MAPIDRAHRAQRRRPGGSPSGLSLLAALVFVALLLLMTSPPLDAPYLDARTHTQFDNAWFSFMARNGLRNGDARSQLGVTLNRYTRWAERAGEPAYYTHHPFLLKAAFQQYARLAGTGEAAARAFALLVAFGIAAGTLLLVRRTTRSLAAGLAAALALACVPVFSRFATTLKFESDGMLAAVVFLLAVERAHSRPDRRGFVFVALAAAASVLAHWSGALAVAATVGLLLLHAWRRSAPVRPGALVAGVTGLAAGATVLAAAMAWLHRGAAPAWRSLTDGFATRAAVAGVPLDAWGARQWVYLRDNFSLPLLAAAVATAALLALDRRRRPPRALDAGDGESAWLLRAATLATLATGVVWVVAFRQGSHVHAYWQLWLALPVAFAAGEVAARVRGDRRLAAVAAVVGLSLAAYLQSANAAARRDLAAAQLGTADDVALLVSLRDRAFERMVFLATARTPLNEWFDGPAFHYYTDRPVVIATASERLTAGDLVLVLRQSDQARAAAALASRFGVRFADERCGRRLCAYTVARP